MEVVGGVASVIAVLGLTAKVSKLLIQYGKKVQHAKDDIAQLQSEISRMDGALERIRILTQTNNVRLEATQEMLSALLRNSENPLAELKKKLEFSKKKKKLMRKLGLRALKWPFQAGDISRIVQNLARYSDDISLSLRIDQT